MTCKRNLTAIRRLIRVEVAIEPPNRAELHERIATRFDQMLEEGLVPEVETLRETFDLIPTLPAMKSVGYRQVWEYLEGDIDWARCVCGASLLQDNSQSDSSRG